MKAREAGSLLVALGAALILALAWIEPEEPEQQDNTLPTYYAELQ